jgi:hypothetical protein
MLFLILGGAAVYRCDNCIVSSAASAAEVTTLARELIFFAAVFRRFSSTAAQELP